MNEEEAPLDVPECWAVPVPEGLTVVYASSPEDALGACTIGVMGAFENEGDTWIDLLISQGWIEFTPDVGTSFAFRGVTNLDDGATASYAIATEANGSQTQFLYTTAP